MFVFILEWILQRKSNRSGKRPQAVRYMLAAQTPTLPTPTMDETTEDQEFNGMLSSLKQLYQNYRQIKSNLTAVNSRHDQLRQEFDRVNKQQEADTCAIHNLNEEIKSVSQELDKKSHELTAAVQNDNQLRKQIASLHKEQSNNYYEIEDLKKSNTVFQSKLAIAHNDSLTKSKKIQELTYTVSTQNQIIEQRIAQLTSLGIANDNLTRNNYNLNNVVNNQSNSFNFKMNQLETEMTALKRANKSLKDENDSLQMYSNLDKSKLTESLDEINSLKKANEELTEFKTTYESKYNDLAKQHMLIKSNLQLKEKKAKETDQIVAQLAKETENLRSTVKKHEDDLKKAKEDHAFSLKQLHIDLDKAKQTANKYEEFLQNIEKQKGLLEEKINKINQNMGFGNHYMPPAEDTTEQYFNKIETSLECFVKQTEEIIRDLETKQDTLAQYENIAKQMNKIKQPDLIKTEAKEISTKRSSNTDEDTAPCKRIKWVRVLGHTYPHE